MARQALPELEQEARKLNQMTMSVRQNINQVVHTMFSSLSWGKRQQAYKLIEDVKRYHEAQAKLRRRYGEHQDAAYHDNKAQHMKSVLALADETNAVWGSK